MSTTGRIVGMVFLVALIAVLGLLAAPEIQRRLTPAVTVRPVIQEKTKELAERLELRLQKLEAAEVKRVLDSIDEGKELSQR